MPDREKTTEANRSPGECADSPTGYAWWEPYEIRPGVLSTRCTCEPCRAPEQTTMAAYVLRAARAQYVTEAPEGVMTYERRLLAEIERLRAIVRINGLRWGHSHEDIDAILKEPAP